MKQDINTELNKIKVVLIDLWTGNGDSTETQKIIDEFKKDIEKIERGN